jgi:Protein of unknown function (DUF4239)
MFIAPREQIARYLKNGANWPEAMRSSAKGLIGDQMFTGIGLIAFCCIFGAGMAGLLLNRILPDDCKTENTQKTVLNIMTVVGILSALVLGLLIAATKANFDTRVKEVEQFAVSLTLLDRELMHFEQDGQGLRDLLRGYTARKIALTWPADRHLKPETHDAQTVQMLDDIEQALRNAPTQTESQREMRKDALQLSAELKRTSRLLVAQQSSTTPRPFLIMVVFWLSMLLLSYAIFAPFNAMVVAALLVCSVSVAAAVNLTFDTDQPFDGFVRVSPISMQQALDEMKP